MSNSTAVVVLSGGQDSVTCLGWALSQFKNVHAVSFDYGQRHKVELVCAAKVCEEYGVPHTIIDMSALGKMVTTNMVGDGDVNDVHSHNSELPSTFVPCRNAMLLTLSHAYAQEVQAEALITGVCETDYSGYPDCRAEFITRLQDALNVGYLTDIKILTPLMFLTKADTFALAESVGFLDVVINESHTCYNGERDTLHEWGYGCGKCPACKLREKGWLEYRSA